MTLSLLRELLRLELLLEKCAPKLRSGLYLAPAQQPMLGLHSHKWLRSPQGEESALSDLILNQVGSTDPCPHLGLLLAERRGTQRTPLQTAGASQQKQSSGGYKSGQGLLADSVGLGFGGERRCAIPKLGEKL